MAQCFERGRRPDALTNLAEFNNLCIPLVALAATVVSKVLLSRSCVTYFVSSFI